jgi:hypothetical protein
MMTKKQILALIVLFIFCGNLKGWAQTNATPTKEDRRKSSGEQFYRKVSLFR